MQTSYVNLLPLRWHSYQSGSYHILNFVSPSFIQPAFRRWGQATEAQLSPGSADEFPVDSYAPHAPCKLVAPVNEAVRLSPQFDTKNHPQSRVWRLSNHSIRTWSGTVTSDG